MHLMANRARAGPAVSEQLPYGQGRFGRKDCRCLPMDSCWQQYAAREMKSHGLFHKSIRYVMYIIYFRLSLLRQAFPAPTGQAGSLFLLAPTNLRLLHKYFPTSGAQCAPH